MTGGICGAPVRRSNRELSLRTECDATRRARSATATGAALIAAGMLAAAGCGKPAGSVSPAPDEARVSERSALNAVTMYGLLVDAQGAPVAGANIEVRAPGESEVVGSDVSDAEGSFDLDVESGVYDVRVIPRDDSRPQTFPRQLIGFNGGGTLELVLAAVATGPVPVSLFIVDQNGHPLPGSACNFSTCVDIGDDGTAQLAADATEGLQVDSSGAWDTGRLRIRPAAIGRGGATVRTIVAPRFQFTGQIVDAGGAPVPGAALSFPTCYAVDTADLASTACPQAKVADANGRFQLTLPPGRFPVVLQAENGPSFDVVIAGDTDVTLTIPAVQHLSGRVVDRDGAGVPLQSVCLSHPTCVTRLCRPLCAQTDGNGLYNLDSPGGDYQLTLFGRLGNDSRFYQLTRAFSLSATQELNFSLPNRTLSGQLLDISGAPAAGVSIFAASYSASIGDLTGVVGAALQVTDTDGRFQFTLAAPGQMQLRVFGPHPGRFDVTVSDDVDLLLQLSPPRDIAGVLMDDNRQRLRASASATRSSRAAIASVPRVTLPVSTN